MNSINKIPKVSVLMPAYNAEKYVGEAIESILNQTFTDFEFIIIDDCSTDRTWEIIQEYAKKDARISVSRNTENLKISKTRNKLIGLAKGEYIAWQDADDISKLDRLVLQFQLLEKSRSIGVCGGWLQFFNKEGNLSKRKYAADDADLRKTIFRYSPVAQPTTMMRASILSETGIFDEKLLQAEDLDLFYRIGQKYKFANIQQVTILYRLHSDSVTVGKLTENIKATLMVRKRAMESGFYTVTLKDKVVYMTTSVVRLLPTNFIYWLFNLIRNEK